MSDPRIPIFVAAALVVSELATNAVKYGALSSPDGLVTLGWSVEGGENGDPVLVITWREQFGPPVSESET